MDRNRKQYVEKLVGIASIASIVIGFLGLLIAMVSFFSGDYTAAGLGLIAAALAFGLFSVAALSG